MTDDPHMEPPRAIDNSDITKCTYCNNQADYKLHHRTSGYTIQACVTCFGKHFAKMLGKINDYNDQQLYCEDCQKYTTVGEVKRYLAANPAAKEQAMEEKKGLWCLDDEHSPKRVDEYLQENLTLCPHCGFVKRWSDWEYEWLDHIYKERGEE